MRLPNMNQVDSTLRPPLSTSMIRAGGLQSARGHDRVFHLGTAAGAVGDVYFASTAVLSPTALFDRCQYSLAGKRTLFSALPP